MTDPAAMTDPAPPYVIDIRGLHKSYGVLEVLNCLQPGKTEFDQADLEALVVYAHVASTAIEKLRYLEADRRRPNQPEGCA